VKTIEYWKVEESYDRDSKEIGNFSSEAVAEEVASKDNKMYRGVYKRTITIFDSIEDFENNSHDKIRARALAKLTVEEKNALGIREDIVSIKRPAPITRPKMIPECGREYG
jgi:hypothetical protein